MSGLIYLDHAATTPVPRPVADAMYEVLADQFGNPSSQYPLGREAKQLVESTHAEVRAERSFTLLEDVNCPAVLAEQCFVTSEEDVAQFGSEEGCKTVARVYYEAICAYFGTQPLDTPL